MMLQSSNSMKIKTFRAHLPSVAAAIVDDPQGGILVVQCFDEAQRENQAPLIMVVDGNGVGLSNRGAPVRDAMFHLINALMMKHTPEGKRVYNFVQCDAYGYFDYVMREYDDTGKLKSIRLVPIRSTDGSPARSADALKSLLPATAIPAMERLKSEFGAKFKKASNRV